MSNFSRGSSSVYRLEAHVCFKTKYAHNVFDYMEFKNRCSEIFCSVAEKYEFSITEMGFDRNHVHLTVFYSIIHSIESIAKWLKGTSGKYLLREFPQIKQKYFYGSGLWSPMIYCDSMGREPEQLYNYVRNQGVQQKDQKSLKQFVN